MKATNLIYIPETANNFVRLRRGIVSHLTEEKLSWDEYAMMLHLIIRANPNSGSLLTSYQGLTDETQGYFKKNKVNKILLSLKSGNYISYPDHRGSGKSFEIFINKYPQSNKRYLYFDKNTEEPAELEVNQQNLRDKINGLAKSKYIDDG